MTLTHDAFEHRHIGPGPAEQQDMLRAIGAASMEALIDETIPPDIRLAAPPDVGEPLSEYEFLQKLRAIASRNRLWRSYLGLGYADCITPPVIQRTILENPGWYTQYTPYQAEVAQGRLEALLNFQTMVADLTGLEIANASLLDEPTAAAEAMTMLHGLAARHTTAAPPHRFFVSSSCLPQTIAVLHTRALPTGIELVIGDHRTARLDSSFFGVLLQYPAEDGAVHDYRDFIAQAHDAGALAVVAADLLSLAVLVPPGDFGADIAVGSAQRFGVPMGYGGPHAAFFAARTDYVRFMPGRIIGVSVDAEGNPALRMTLQTREQHIRREKATSNICTAQALLAIMAGMYGVYHGPAGIRRIAARVHAAAAALERALGALGCTQRNAVFFDTLRIASPTPTAGIRACAEAASINFRYFDDGTIGISLDETVTDADLQRIVRTFADAGNATTVPTIPPLHESALPAPFGRTRPFMTHPVFHRYRSETAMLRYIKSLENKDLSLTHSMIPLGSCTMKLNAAAELFPISWPEFSRLHPFVPAAQAEGYAVIFQELSARLCAITGLAAASLQPNSGAQGEYAGLMVVRAYHQDRGQGHRNVVLIPSSAHGTNPASAVMAGYRVVVVRSDARGNIDVADLRRQAEAHSATLAALMVTYPSTHGIFEESIREICAVVHACDGQVYMDGANLNAQVGLTSPGLIGADVCHINLHKTFAIPHGGGGPGMGPICVAPHLAPYLPGHPLVNTGGDKAITAVAGAPWGSASILLISYAYITMLGTRGITASTTAAILNANYLKTRLQRDFPVLYEGSRGRCAHEFILDLRHFKAEADIEAEDVAKRLMDYGFHAPTVSFPVPGTLMIEPTESEDRAELDRFADALIAIRREIGEIADGTADRVDNLLKNAPHTAGAALSDTWTHPYPRARAVFPLPFVRSRKFWPASARVNNSYGDRNIMCVCPPVGDYAQENAGE
jgi:glycine dehydrogenase